MLTRVELLLTKSAAFSSSSVSVPSRGLDGDDSAVSSLLSPPSYLSTPLYPMLSSEKYLGGVGEVGGLAVFLTQIQILEIMSEPFLYRQDPVLLSPIGPITSRIFSFVLKETTRSL